MDPARLGPHPSSPNGGTLGLNSEQRDALELAQQAAQKHQLRFISRPGDIIFLNNLSLLHARTAYNDSEGTSRHLVRMWLRNAEQGWPIPRSMEPPWNAVFGEKAKTVLNRQYPCAPMPKFMESKYSNGTAAFVAEEDSDAEVIDL